MPGGYHTDQGRWTPNLPIRAAVEEALKDGMTLSLITRRLGWIRGDGSPDVTRLRRRVGLAPVINSSHGRHSQRLSHTQNVRIDIAVKIVEALGADPVDFDL